MKKDQNLTKKNIHSKKAPENHFQITPIIRETNHLLTIVIEADHQNNEIHENFYKTDNVSKQLFRIKLEQTRIFI